MWLDCVVLQKIKILLILLYNYVFKKLSRRTAALELVKWTDQHEKGKVAEILVMDAMSSEETCCEGDENGKSRVVRYAVKRLSWESRRLRKMKKKLDKA